MGAKAFLRAVLPPVVVTVARRVRGGIDPDTALSLPDPPLSDGVIELRPIEERDVDIVTYAARDPEISRRFGLSRLFTPSEYVVRYLKASSAGTGVALVICDAGGEGSGLVTLELRGSGRAEAGYWVLPGGRGQGRATRALRLIAGWALSQHGVVRLELSTAPENVASQRVAERSGFRREGVLRSYHEVSGCREDAVFYSLLGDDLGREGRSAACADALALGWLIERADVIEGVAGVGLKLCGVH